MKTKLGVLVSIVVVAVVLSAGEPENQRVFASSQIVYGNMGGLNGADALCQGLADDAQLGGDWVAWLSDSSTDARDRINGEGPFVRMDGAQIAADRADLLDGNLEFAISLDEHGNAPPQNTVVTGTLANGYSYVGDATFCNDWISSASALTPVGFANVTNSGWSFAGSGNCNHPLLLYCFELVLDPIFADDFESGGTGRWSAAVP